MTIAIDDFGTGFSSLSYLRELPIDVLKIAKPIIDAICESTQDAAFVKGIIELGHVVGMQVVAEGVEQVEQYAHLVDMGCDFVQGYYYAPSMDPVELAAVLAAAAPVPPAPVDRAGGSDARLVAGATPELGGTGRSMSGPEPGDTWESGGTVRSDPGRTA